MKLSLNIVLAFVCSFYAVVVEGFGLHWFYSWLPLALYLLFSLIDGFIQ